MYHVWDTTEGFFSRWVVVPFTAFFPAGKADPSLIAALTSPGNLQGLLRRSVLGLQSVMRRQAFGIPQSVINATANFRKEADPVRAFIDDRLDCVHPNNAPHVARSEVYLAYTVWASLNGYHQMSAQRFYEELAAAVLGVTTYPFRVARVDGIEGFKGIVLK